MCTDLTFGPEFTELLELIARVHSSFESLCCPRISTRVISIHKLALQEQVKACFDGFFEFPHLVGDLVGDRLRKRGWPQNLDCLVDWRYAYLILNISLLKSVKFQTSKARRLQETSSENSKSKPYILWSVDPISLLHTNKKNQTNQKTMKK